jgi:hypothetical protein
MRNGISDIVEFVNPAQRIANIDLKTLKPEFDELYLLSKIKISLKQQTRKRIQIEHDLKNIVDGCFNVGERCQKRPTYRQFFSWDFDAIKDPALCIQNNSKYSLCSHSVTSA